MTEEERFYDLRFYSGLNVNDIDVAHILNKDQKDRRYVSSAAGINHQIIKKMVEDENYVMSIDEKVKAFNINVMAFLCIMASIVNWIHSLIGMKWKVYREMTNLVSDVKTIPYMLVHVKMDSSFTKRQNWFFSKYIHILDNLYNYKVTYELQKINMAIQPKQYILQLVSQLTNFITPKYDEYLRDFASEISGEKAIARILTEFQCSQTERR